MSGFDSRAFSRISKKKVNLENQLSQHLRTKSIGSGESDPDAKNIAEKSAFRVESSRAKPTIDEELLGELNSYSDWDIAVRYHDLKKTDLNTIQKQILRAKAIDEVMRRAREMMKAVLRPENIQVQNLLDAPSDLSELNLDQTLEDNLLKLINDEPLEPEEIWMDTRKEREQPVVLCIDTSLSMTGDKLAWTAIAIAIVLIQFNRDPLGIIAFENTARVLKNVREKAPLRTLLERFLDVPAEGYTHLELGVKNAAELIQNDRESPLQKKVVTLLVTDGKYTAGKEPLYLAPRFSKLSVLKMGSDRSSRILCEEMAQKGGGQYYEVPEVEALPSTMISVIKDLVRGTRSSNQYSRKALAVG